MITARRAAPEPRDTVLAHGAPRHRRRPSRRRIVIEKMVILLIFLAALGVTVWLLASQWRLPTTATGTVPTVAAVPTRHLPTPS